MLSAPQCGDNRSDELEMSAIESVDLFYGLANLSQLTPVRMRSADVCCKRARATNLFLIRSN